MGCKLDWCNRAAKTKGLCARHYERWRSTGLLTKSQAEKTPEERFWERVEVTSECWFWVPAKNPDRHGQFKAPDGGWLAHRYSFFLATGTHPGAGEVLQTCGVRSCVNPSHLLLSATDEDRFWAKVDASGDCWVWLGTKNQYGYGRFTASTDQFTWGAHRWSYTTLVGPIPDGLVIDHLCKQPACVNPDHLEPVTQAENVRRGGSGQHWAAKTHCPQGHAYTGENLKINTRGRRECRECRRVSARLSQRDRRAAMKVSLSAAM